MSEITPDDYLAVDSKGYCVRHPAIKLRRRCAESGEWKPLLRSCPMCDPLLGGESTRRRTTGDGRDRASFFRLDSRDSAGSRSSFRSSTSASSGRVRELRGLSSSRSISRNDDDDENDDDGLSPLHPGKASLLLPTQCMNEMSALSLLSSSTDTTVASSSASSNGSCGYSYYSRQHSTPATFSTPDTSDSRRKSLPPISPLTQSSAGSMASSPSSSSRRQHSSNTGRTRNNDNSSSNSSGKKRVVVCGLRYSDPVDPHRRSGSYTGQLHPESQLPHGLGTLRYADGSVREGEWREGNLLAVDGKRSEAGAGSGRSGEVGGGAPPSGEDGAPALALRCKSKGRGRAVGPAVGDVDDVRKSFRSKSRDGRGRMSVEEEIHCDREWRTGRTKSRSRRTTFRLRDNASGSTASLSPSTSSISTATGAQYHSQSSTCDASPGSSFSQRGLANHASPINQKVASPISRRSGFREGGSPGSYQNKRIQLVSLSPPPFDLGDVSKQQEQMLHQQQALVPYLYSVDPDIDDENDLSENSLGTCEKSRCSSQGGGSARGRRPPGPYSARESKGTSATGTCRGLDGDPSSSTDLALWSRLRRPSDEQDAESSERWRDVRAASGGGASLSQSARRTFREAKR